MPNCLFDFFELIADDLCSEPSRVITSETLRTDPEKAPILDDLKQEVGASSAEEAIRIAVLRLTDHFKEKSSPLPFSYNPRDGQFVALDIPFLRFIQQMRSIRSIGKCSKEFELSVFDKLRGRTTGSLHRVGHPRERLKRKVDFNNHLRSIGFQNPVLLGQDKDGGFDILWVLPIGSKPHRPIVSVQCKNGSFSMDECDKSVGAATRSLGQHGGLQPQVHILCVLFNDYLHPSRLTKKPLNFVPLGLSDLCNLTESLSHSTL